MRFIPLYCLTCFCFLFCALSALSEEYKLQPVVTVPSSSSKNLPPELPVSVPAVPVVPPSTPNPPPVQPSFAPTPNTPSTLDTATDKVLDLIQNPEQIGKTIGQVPQMIPEQFQRAKDRVTNGPSDPSIFTGKNFEVLKWHNSLMFPANQLKQLYDVAKGLTDQSVGAVVVEVKVPHVAPAFFVNSVLYNTPDNWTIWLNSRRIRSGSKFPELEISKVDRDAVEFIWETELLDAISPDWEKKVMPLELKPGEPVPRFVYQSKDGLIAVDKSRRFVRFIIGPHQTFVSKEMKIVEGFVKSTIFQTVNHVTSQPAGSPQIQIQPSTGASAIPTPIKK